MKIKNIDPYYNNTIYQCAEITIVIYLLFAYPFLIILTPMAFILFQEGHPESIYWFYTLTPITAITTISIITIITKQRQKINFFKTRLKENGFFDPIKSNECMTLTGSHYLGIDVNKGIFVFISHTKTSLRSLLIPKDYIVMGFGIKDYASASQFSKRITIYTGRPDIPRLIFTHRRASELCSKISAMRFCDYQHEQNVIPDYVNSIARQVAEEKNLNLIMSRFS